MRKSENEGENHHPYEKRFVFVFVLCFINKERNISALGKKLHFVVLIPRSFLRRVVKFLRGRWGFLSEGLGRLGGNQCFFFLKKLLKRR